MPESEFRVEVRPAVDNDLAYISSTWLKAYLSGSALGSRMSHETYYTLHRPLVASLLGRCTVTVAHPAEDHDTILGFIVCAPGVVHMLYVRNAWRGNGIARTLMADRDPNATLFTCWTEAGASLARKYRGLTYYPYAARGV